MWPLKLDMTKDECRGVLRRLELDTYSSVMSTFRAQGTLDNNKQNVLDQLRRCFHISEDRHKAEARRVSMNEELTTISELTTGKTYDLEWIREGHRNYPLIGRSAPYSALHLLADHASKAAAIDNSALANPSDTKRSRTWDEEIPGKPIITEDPTLPPPSPTVFGINRKDLKKNFDLTALHQNARKKHYQHLKPPPPPNVKIQHLYQTLNAKRPRKSLTKKASKARVTKQSPGRMHLPFPPDDKHFDGAELQRHLTSQLMPPPMSPMKSQFVLPAGTSKKDMNLIKMNHQSLEPQAHYIPNNPTRLKSELMSDTTSKGRSGRSKGVHMQPRGNYQQKYANGAGARNIDHIPDPQIIFNTTSSSKIDQTMDAMEQHSSREIDLSQQGMTSPLQLLSTAASCTPKLKVTPSIHQQQHPSTMSQSLPLPSQNANKMMQNRAIKIIPASTKPVIIKPADTLKSTQSIITAQSSKFKIQKIQLVMNKNQDGTATTANLSPSATIVSGKAGQLLLSGKGITNSYQVSGKTPYTIVSAQKASGPKVIVQAIDRNFSAESSIPENQRITENTPIDFMPSSTTTTYPKVIIQKTQATSSKQIKLKLGANLVNPKIIKGPIPANLKIQRNINTKGFTVLNSSQIVQLQAQQTQQVQASTPVITAEGTKVDWEQELDDANRNQGGKSVSNGASSGPAAKKLRLDDAEGTEVTVLEGPESEDIVEPVASLLVFEESSQAGAPTILYKNTVEVPEQEPSNISGISEFVFLNHEDDVTASKSVEEEEMPPIIVNGEDISEVNGEMEVDQERHPQNGAQAYENLVSKLMSSDSDYMKEITEDTHAQMEENFGLLDQFSSFSRDTGLYQ